MQACGLRWKGACAFARWAPWKPGSILLGHRQAHRPSMPELGALPLQSIHRLDQNARHRHQLRNAIVLDFDLAMDRPQGLVDDLFHRPVDPQRGFNLLKTASFQM